jgi:hypothetical protein
VTRYKLASAKTGSSTFPVDKNINQANAVIATKTSKDSITHERLLPLPKGEGRGEGEGPVKSANASSPKGANQPSTHFPINHLRASLHHILLPGSIPLIEEAENSIRSRAEYETGSSCR